MLIRWTQTMTPNNTNSGDRAVARSLFLAPPSASRSLQSPARSPLPDAAPSVLKPLPPVPGKIPPCGRGALLPETAPSRSRHDSRVRTLRPPARSEPPEGAGRRLVPRLDPLRKPAIPPGFRLLPRDSPASTSNWRRSLEGTARAPTTGHDPRRKEPTPQRAPCPHEGLAIRKEGWTRSLSTGLTAYLSHDILHRLIERTPRAGEPLRNSDLRRHRLI